LCTSFGVDYKIGTMTDLWKDKDPATWEAILDRYYDIVAKIGKDLLLELEMCALLKILNYNSNTSATTAFPSLYYYPLNTYSWFFLTIAGGSKKNSQR
jgi:hypothetical protein